MKPITLTDSQLDAALGLPARSWDVRLCDKIERHFRDGGRMPSLLKLAGMAEVARLIFALTKDGNQ